MQKVIIYYGPKLGFKTILPDEFKTLTEVVSESEAKRNIISLQSNNNPEREEITYIKTLVAYSESYAGITEGAVQSFVGLLSRYDIGTLYLQNPTVQIKHQIEQSYNEIIKVEKYKYKNFTKNMFVKFNEDFPKKIIGQDKAKERILMSLYPLLKKRNNKPAVLMFYGSSGVGKTETAKFLSDILGQSLFRKQFSMFHSEQFSSYLFGGNHSQSCFAKDLLERESNIILIDEFDKPAPVFHSAFYQIFDEGTFEDKNYQVELYNALIICTSNYKSEEEIRKHLGDPIYYRFDKFIKFDDLSQESLKNVIEKLSCEKYNSLNRSEKKIIDLVEMKANFIKNINGFKNVRHISNIIDEYIEIKLVRNFLDSQ